MYDSAPEQLQGLLTSMFTTARSAYDRAVVNADQLGHRQVGDAHLLLGILALGNSDATLPIPRTLRTAGADYRALYTFLSLRTELRGPVTTGGLPKPSEMTMRTLMRAGRIARRRARRESQNAIITSDLLVALLGSRDPLLREAFEKMEVDRKSLRRTFVTVKVEAAPLHLHAVD